MSQKVVAQIARIPHRPVCRIKCTCSGFFLAFRNDGAALIGHTEDHSLLIWDVHKVIQTQQP
jgi:hypothetical protein